MRLFVFVALLLAAVPAAAHEFTVGDLTIHHPWARATLNPKAPGAVYMEIVNAGAEDQLLSASTPQAASVELHAMTMENGVASMAMLETLPIPANSTLMIEPNGLHLMLIDLTAPLVEDQYFSLTLVFEKAGEVTLEVKVEAADETGENLEE